MTPGDRHSVGIQAGGQAVVIIGAIDVVLDVLLPAPDDFHRPVDLLGDGDRLRDPVNVQPSAEAAADKMIVHLDLLQWQAGHLRGGGLSAAHNLVPDPDVAAVAAYMHGAVHRLHRGVGEKRKLVDRLDLPGGAGQRLGDVAFLAGDHSGLLRRRIHLLDDVSGGERGVRAVVPVDIERGEALHRGPRAIAYDGNGIVEPHHLAHALDRHCLAVVDAGELSAQHRAGGDRGKLHAGDHRVDAIYRLAIHLVGRVDTLGRCSDQREVLRVLERDAGRYRQLRRRIDQGPVFKRLAGRRMNHFSMFGVARGWIDVPLSRRRGDQHDARDGTSTAKWFPHCHDRGRAAGDLEPEQRIGIELVVGRRGLEGDLRKIDLQLFGDEHRHRGVSALSHLDLRHDQSDAVVATDANEGVRSENVGTRGRGSSTPQLRQIEPNEHSTACRRTRHQEGSARDAD